MAKFTNNIVVQKFPMIFSLWWILWTAIHLVLLFYSGIGFNNSAIDAVISNFILAMLSLALINVLKNYNPNSNFRFFHLFLGIALTAIHISIFRFVIHEFFEKDTVWLSLIDSTLALRFAFSLLMIIAIIIISWFWVDLRDDEKERVREASADDLLKKAELANLKQQMQPHFLFNSLNSINALIGSDPKKARQMIQQLSDFLRGTLKKDDLQNVKLEEEIEQLNIYLEIEKVRFGYRLETKIEISDSAKASMLPALILQPIVENAIKFGLYGTTEKIIIKINAELQDNYLYLQVENPFDAQTVGSSSGAGFGLHSIQRRLYLLFGRNDLLITKAENNIFITQVKIPQQHV